MNCISRKTICILAFVATPILADDPKTLLAERGIDIGVGITNIYQHSSETNVNIPTNRNEYAGSYDVELDFDLEKLLNIGGGIYMHIEGGWHPADHDHEYSVRTFTGPNADYIGKRAFDIVELFYHNQISDNLSVAVGKLDMTVFFDTGAYANDETTQFFNGALVNNSTIPFPDYGLGIVGNLALTETISLSAGVADAQAYRSHTGFNSTFKGEDYYFYIAEATYTLEATLPASYAVGIWYDPQPKGYSGSDKEYRDDTGLYFNYDQKLFNEADDNEQGLGMFFKYGYADKKKNDIKSYFAAGLQYKGLFNGRDDDVFGIGYANLGLTNLGGSELNCKHEGIIETYYSFSLCPEFQLSPDIQYIVNPDYGNLDNTVILGLRGQLSF